MQHRILLAGAFLHLTISNLVWIARDSLPPFWDMAHHQSGALRILYAFRESGVAALWDVPSLTGSYPPAVPLHCRRFLRDLRNLDRFSPAGKHSRNSNLDGFDVSDREAPDVPDGGRCGGCAGCLLSVADLVVTCNSH